MAPFFPQELLYSYALRTFQNLGGPFDRHHLAFYHPNPKTLGIRWGILML
jgi:hypothetical protein